MAEIMRFVCPKCAHDRCYVATGVTMVCRACGHEGPSRTFNLEKRPSPKREEARERHADE